MVVGERNLTPQRGPNVWAREEPAAGAPRRRWVDGLGGAAMAAAGAALIAAGGSRVFRALSPSAAPASSPAGPDYEDIVADESEQSFPASDSPSWTPVDGASPRRSGR